MSYLDLQLQQAQKQYYVWESRHEAALKEVELAERQMNHWDDRTVELEQELAKAAS